MAISKAQIFNITLNILGVSAPLENTNSDDNRAILLNNYYELARDFVLKDFDWNFASTTRKLTLNIDNDNYEYNFCYDYPNDCVCARDIFEEGNYKLQKFKISSNQNGQKIILTNVQNAILRYTKIIDQEIFFTSEFTMALCYYLAFLTAGVIVGSIQKGEIAFEKYRTFLRRAKLLNAQEGLDEVYEDITYLESRY